ncbi:MAG: hypothetical protein Q9166_001825 [cf. Caloplaca sp. 2 TL-2023]
MTLSRKAQRKISKEHKRALSECNVGPGSPKVSTVKDNSSSNTTDSLDALGNCDTRQRKAWGSNESTGNCSLNRAIGSLATPAPTVSHDNEEHPPVDAPTLSPSRHYRESPDNQCPAPPLDCRAQPSASESYSSVESDNSSNDPSAAMYGRQEATVNEASQIDACVECAAGGTTGRVTTLMRRRNDGTFSVEHATMEDALAFVLEQLDTRRPEVESHRVGLQADYRDTVSPSASSLLNTSTTPPTQPTPDLPASPDGLDTKHQPIESRTQRWVEENLHHDSRSPPASPLAGHVSHPPSFKAAIEPLRVSATANANGVLLTEITDHASDAKSSRSTPVGSPQLLKLLGEAAARRTLDNSATSDPFIQSYDRHPRGPPWGYHPQSNYPNLYSPRPKIPVGTIFPYDWSPSAISDPHDDTTKVPQDPTLQQMSTIQPEQMPEWRKVPQRYEQGYYRMSQGTSKRLQRPDWTYNARRDVTAPSAGLHRMMALTAMKDRHAKLCRDYTLRHYGCGLDRARHLPHTEPPKKEFDLGGLRR